MGHLQDMTDEQRRELKSYQYKRYKESRRGCSYPYWNEKLDKDLTDKGYKMHQFLTGMDKDATRVLLTAKEVVKALREKGNYARIICGYSQNQQKITMYSIYFRPRKK